MLLGDRVYSDTSVKSYMKQLLEAYESSGQLTIALDEISVDRTMYYGTVTGQFIDGEERRMQISDIVEKPTAEYAEAHLGVRGKKGEARYYCVFGQYVLTPQTFELLGRNIREGRKAGSEYELTSVLREICMTDGMTGYRVDGKRYDIGIPQEYRKTVSDFGYERTGRNSATESESE